MKIVLQNSGGLDSLITAKILYNQGYEIYSLFYDFGQHNLDRAMISAQNIADEYCTLGHEILTIKSNKRETFNTRNMLNPAIEDRMPPRLPYTGTATAIWAAVVAVNENIDYIASGIKGTRRPISAEEHRNNLRKVLSGGRIGEAVTIVNPISHLIGVQDTVAKGLKLGLSMETMSQTVSCNAEVPCGTCFKCKERTETGLEIN